MPTSSQRSAENYTEMYTHSYQSIQDFRIHQWAFSRVFADRSLLGQRYFSFSLIESIGVTLGIQLYANCMLQTSWYKGVRVWGKMWNKFYAGHTFLLTTYLFLVFIYSQHVVHLFVHRAIQMVYIKPHRELRMCS